MSFDDEFGRDLVQSTINRVLEIYKGPLVDKNDPLRENDLLGPILEKLEGSDTGALIELIEHCSVMAVHATVDHFVNFKSLESGYGIEVNIVQENGERRSVFDFFDDPGSELVVEGGWADKFCDRQA